MTSQTVSSPKVLAADDAARWLPPPTTVVGLPEELLKRYIGMALRQATPERMDEQKWYCALDAFPGVWADGDSVKECLDTLEEVLLDWLLLKIVDGDTDIPVVDDIDWSVISRRFRR